MTDRKRKLSTKWLGEACRVNKKEVVQFGMFELVCMVIVVVVG